MEKARRFKENGGVVRKNRAESEKTAGAEVGGSSAEFTEKTAYKPKNLQAAF